MNKENQMKAVREWLLSGKPLTSMDAIEMFGCTRLADKVHRLRKEGLIIITERREGITRYGTPCVYAEYICLGVEKGAEING